MLDQLIESRNHAEENVKRGGFLLATFFLVTTMLMSGVLWSLFAKNIEMGHDGLELSTLLAPVPVVENEPVETIPEQERRDQPQTMENITPTRQTNMARIDESQPAPDRISVMPNTQKARPLGDFLIKEGIEIQGSSAGNLSRGDNDRGAGLQRGSPAQSEVIEKPAPPPALVIKKKIEEAAPKSKPPISGGVVNGMAKSLPKPIYSAAAKAMGVSGDVNIQVTIDEKGNVVSAKALNGHPLLQVEAERAARNAKFSPTILTGQPVKVTGIIVYKFSKN